MRLLLVDDDPDFRSFIEGVDLNRFYRFLAAFRDLIGAGGFASVDRENQVSKVEKKGRSEP